MYTAIGTGARNLEGGGIEVTVSIKRDDGTEVGQQTFRGDSLDAIVPQIADAVAARLGAEQDADLNAQVIGQTLATAVTDEGGKVVKTTGVLAAAVKAIVVLLVCLVLGGHAIAQAPAETAPPAAPTLTDLERAKLELLQVRTAYAQLLAQYDSCKAEVGAAFNALGQLRSKQASDQLSVQEMQLKIAVEAGHPGYAFDPKTQAFTKKDSPPPAPKK